MSARTAKQSDYAEMLAAADDWGPRADPERRWFLAGWRDEADRKIGDNQPPEATMAAMCAYNSGIIAARWAMAPFPSDRRGR